MPLLCHLHFRFFVCKFMGIFSIFPPSSCLLPLLIYITPIPQVTPLYSSQVPSISNVQNGCWNLQHVNCLSTPALQATETRPIKEVAPLLLYHTYLPKGCYLGYMCMHVCMHVRDLRCVLSHFFRMIKIWSMNLSVQMV